MSTRRLEHGFLYEDFVVGRLFEHHWGRTFTAHDTIWFSTMTMQFNPVNFNDEYARSLGYDRSPINPCLVFSTALGLSVQDLSEAGGPFLGVDDVLFGTPAYPGDTMTASSIVISRRLSVSRPGWGIVEWKTAAVNQAGAQVVEFRRRNLSRVRDARNDDGAVLK